MNFNCSVFFISGVPANVSDGYVYNRTFCYQADEDIHQDFVNKTGEYLEISMCKHINQIVSKLSSACYAVRALTPLLSINTLKMLYLSYAHSIISYGIIFWGASTNSIKIFRFQKKILKIMTKSKKTESCRKLFKEMEILPFYSQYIFSPFNVCGEKQTFIYKELANS